MSSDKLIMPQDDLRKLQLIQLEMLLEVDRICRENHIQYFLWAGTALGAVRHKGFIPWDDDLDLCMMRSEYEQFCKVCGDQLDESRFFLQNDKTDEAYRWGYAKIRRKGTEYLRAGQEAIKCVSGVSIDIFVMDYVPRVRWMQNLYFYTRRLCIKTLWSVIGATYETNRVKRLCYKGLRHIPKKVPLGMMEWMAKQTNHHPSSGIVCTGFYRKSEFKDDHEFSIRGYKASYLEKFVEMDFEGFSFYMFQNYDEYLKDFYGDYWQYPPDSSRLIHPPRSYCLHVEPVLRGRDVTSYMEKNLYF